MSSASSPSTVRYALLSEQPVIDENIIIAAKIKAGTTICFFKSITPVFIVYYMVTCVRRKINGGNMGRYADILLMDYQYPRKCCIKRLTAAMPTQQQNPIIIALPPFFIKVAMFVLRPIAHMTIAIKNFASHFVNATKESL